MLKKIIAGLGVSLIAATLAYAQNAPQGDGAAPAAGAARGARGAGGAGGAGGAAGGGGRGGVQKLPTEAQWAAMGPKAKAYVAKAAALAGNDPDLKFDMGVFCKASGGAGNNDRATIGVPEGAPYPAWGAPSPAVRLPAQHLFDNFWWLGDTGVGSWLITSNDGYILFDASNNAAEAQEVIVDAMTKVGLDPKKIKYMVFGHFHGDHTGGGHLIQTISGAKAIMGRDDWELYLKMFDSPNNRLDDKTPMTRDIDAVDGQKITVGDVTATIFQMTGHTPGSIGMVTPIKWKGQTHNILLVTAGSDVGSREAFVGGYEHIWDEGIKMKVESVMQVHPNTNMNLLARVKYVNDNFSKLGANQNPLLYGVDRTARYLNIVRNCTLARMDILGW
jgi:metallo-beta-lactamase class B